MSIDEFARCHWERAPVVIRGSPAKLERLGLASVNRDGFTREVQAAATDARPGFAVNALRKRSRLRP